MIQNRTFTKTEMRYLIDQFTRMFQDPHGKVFSMFLDVLHEFIRLYKRDLQDWLYTLLTRILTKVGSESLTSVHQKLRKCLECVRVSFDLDLQFNLLIKFINDKSQTPSLKVKIAILMYLQDIIICMEAVDFHTTDELKCAISKIISLTAEPKSADIRKNAQAVLIALFNLNTPEFSMLISGLPYRLQQPATTILNNHIKNFSQDSSSSTFGINYGASNNGAMKSPTNGYKQLTYDHNTQLSHVIQDIKNLTTVNKYDSRANEMSLLINERFTTSSRLDSLSKDSGIQSNGGDYQDEQLITKTKQSKLKSFDSIVDAIKITNNNNQDQMIQILNDLSQTIQFGSKIDSKLSENFSTILIRLFDLLPNKEMSIQLSALTTLRDLLQFHSKEFSNYIELTICKLVDQYKEPQNEVSKTVEEVIYTAAQCLSPEQSICVLKPIIQAPEYPKNLIAIRMLEKILNVSVNNEMCRRYLGDILTPLLTVSVLIIRNMIEFSFINYLGLG
jgi:CLIP-associating protein 1/2